VLNENQVKAAIRAVREGGKRTVELKDAGARGAGRLALIVRKLSSGVVAEWYAVSYRDAGRQMAKLGTYGENLMTLAQAREKFRAEYQPKIAAGEGVRSRASRGAQPPGTVKELFEAYVGDLRRRGLRAADSVEFILIAGRKNAAEAIGADRLASSVSYRDITEHLSDIHARGAKAMALQVRGYLSAAFEFGLRSPRTYTQDRAGRDWQIAVNPVHGVEVDQAARRAGNRYLRPTEVRAFWDWLATEGDERSPTARALRLQIATGQRSEEILRIATATCSKPSAEIGIYDPASRTLFWGETKNGLPHLIPLPDQAVAVLEAGFPNKHGLFFPHARHSTVPAPYTAAWRVVAMYCREKLNVDVGDAAWFTPRCLRRTWKTLAGPAVSREMRDRLQNHAKGDVASKHYDRYEYINEKRAAMDAWSTLLGRILAGELEDNVVEMKPPVAA
jgi:hypothetical protein